MNIRKLEDLSKDELIELIKHERETCGQLKPISVEEPDARLIAAAPELLGALKNLLDISLKYKTEESDIVVEDARAVIAKALGEDK